MNILYEKIYIATWHIVYGKCFNILCVHMDKWNMEVSECVDNICEKKSVLWLQVLNS